MLAAFLYGNLGQHRSIWAAASVSPRASSVANSLYSASTFAGEKKMPHAKLYAEYVYVLIHDWRRSSAIDLDSIRRTRWSHSRHHGDKVMKQGTWVTTLDVDGQNKPPKVACIVSGHAARKYISDIFRRTFDDQWDKKIRASEPGKKGKSKNRESKISFRQIMTQTYLSYDRSLTWTTDEDIPYFRKHMWWGISYWRQWIDLDFFTQNIYSITLPSIEKWTCSDSKMKNQRKREKGLFKINFIFHVSELLKFSNHIFA